VDAGRQLGLVHARLRTARGSGRVGLVWRADAASRSSWQLLVGTKGAELALVRPDGVEVVAESARPRLRPGTTHSVQVIDDGTTFSLHLDGAMLFDNWFVDTRMANGTGAGVVFDGEPDATTSVEDFEAHERTVPAPLLEQPQWPLLPESGAMVVDEHFEAVAADLHECSTPSGGRIWRRIEGKGHFRLEGEGARVDATADRPNPGRTIYGFDWEYPSGVDVSVTSTPPGTRRGERHNGRGGLVLWQDEDNYLVINTWLDDWLVGTSVSTFYRVRGHEDMYDAVWTLVGTDVSWGGPYTLRVVFDGSRFVAYVDGRPVLYRAVRDVYPDAPVLTVTKVALIANEEWGDDTGTVFTRVVAAPLIESGGGRT